MFHTDEKDTEKGAGGLAFRDRSINLDGNLWEVLKTVVSIMLRLYKAFGSEEPSDRFVPEFFGRSIDLDGAYPGYPVAYRAAPTIAAPQLRPVVRPAGYYARSISPGKY